MRTADTQSLFLHERPAVFAVSGVHTRYLHIHEIRFIHGLVWTRGGALKVFTGSYYIDINVFINGGCAL